MENCKHCSKPLKHVPGRKQKSFCNPNCRNKYFYAERKKIIEAAKAALIPLPSAYVTVKKVGVLTKDGTAKPLIPKTPKVDAPIKPVHEVLGSHMRPRNLDELKKLCPPELTGFDRSAWISTERQKYGI